MELLGNESSRVYRATVFEDADFHEFFCQITPIDVVERMQQLMQMVESQQMRQQPEKHFLALPDLIALSDLAPGPLDDYVPVCTQSSRGAGGITISFCVTFSCCCSLASSSYLRTRAMFFA